MPVIRGTEGTEHSIHGVTFTAFANTATGSTELAAWNCHIEAARPGVEHRISKEEVFLVLAGTPRFTLDGEVVDAAAGDVVLAPADCLLKVENPGDQDADIWVTTSRGLTAKTADGGELAPPWAQ